MRKKKLVLKTPKRLKGGRLTKAAKPKVVNVQPPKKVVLGPKVIKFKVTEREEWLATRRGKITGSKLRDIVGRPGNGRKIGFYELIAEKLGMPPEDEENAMERGTRLESDALARFAKETKKKLDTALILWCRPENENIAISPDGVVSEREAVEAKCLSSARHIEAFLTQRIPADYRYQALQYFVVNDKLKILHFVFFDPRFALFSDPAGKQAKLDYFVITTTRKELQKEIAETLEYERQVMAEVNEIVNKLTF